MKKIFGRVCGALTAAALLAGALSACGGQQQAGTAAPDSGAAFAGKFVLPPVEKESQHSWYQYTILAADTAQRERIEAHLKEKGIPSMVYYPTPQHALPVFQRLESYGETFPNALDYCARTLSLPMHPYLDEGTQDGVIEAVLEAL